MPQEIGHGVFQLGHRLIGVPLEYLEEVCVVPRLSPMLDPGSAVLGAVDLRGTMVPVLDVGAIAGFPRRTDAPRSAAILRRGSQITAIAVDEIVDLFKAVPFALYRGGNEDDHGARLFHQGFTRGRDMVACLDIDWLFETKEVLSVTASRMANRETAVLDQIKLLTVTSGGARFAIDAIRIDATVPQREIDTAEVSGDLLLGFIQHQNRKVPVVDAGCALGLGRTERRSSAQIVILRFPENMLLGLAVDSMENIISVPNSDIGKSSPLISAAGLLLSVFVGPGAQQTHVIDMEALQKVPSLVELSRLTTRLQDMPTRGSALPEGKHVLQERQPYLVFRAGRLLSVPITEILNIRKTPAVLVPAGDGLDPSVLGFVTIDEQSVPVVNLPDRTMNESPAEYLLSVGAPGRQVAFAVDKIEGLKNSICRFADSSNPMKEDIVELNAAGPDTVLPVADLARMARELTDPANML